MNLPETIFAHARALPADLQRETLDFIAYLEQRYGLVPPASERLSTEAFIQRFAGCLGEDFPDCVGQSGLGEDTPREVLE